jgi:hypothetical protein
MSHGLPLTWDHTTSAGTGTHAGSWILVHTYEDGTVHIGPFTTEGEAMTFMNDWPDDEDMTDDPFIAPLNSPQNVGAVKT